MKLVALVVLLAAGVRLVRSTLAVVEVAGPSMRPALSSGDRVLVRRARRGGLRSGLVVVIEQPDVAGRWRQDPPRWPPRGRRDWLIKRVAALPGDPMPPGVPRPGGAGGRGPAALGAEADDGLVPPGMFVVLGDNAACSLDSRVIGCIPADRLIGVMVRVLRETPAR